MTIVFFEHLQGEHAWGGAFPGLYFKRSCGLEFFFSQGTTASMSGLVWGGGNLLQRIFVPRTIFAVSAVGTALVNTVIALVPLIIVMLITQATFSWALLFYQLPSFL